MQSPHQACLLIMALRSPPQMRKKKRNPAKYLIMKASICNCMELLSYQRTEHLKCVVGCDSDIWALLHERSSPPMCCSSVCFGGLLMRDLFTSAKNWVVVWNVLDQLFMKVCMCSCFQVFNCTIFPSWGGWILDLELHQTLKLSSKEPTCKWSYTSSCWVKSFVHWKSITESCLCYLQIQGK